MFGQKKNVKFNGTQAFRLEEYMKTEINDRKYNEVNVEFKISVKILETNLTFIVVAFLFILIIEEKFKSYRVKA